MFFVCFWALIHPRAQLHGKPYPPYTAKNLAECALLLVLLEKLARPL
jgi:hypothetical protein